jgi:hypothetical protein
MTQESGCGSGVFTLLLVIAYLSFFKGHPLAGMALFIVEWVNANVAVHVVARDTTSLSGKDINDETMPDLSVISVGLPLFSSSQCTTQCADRPADSAFAYLPRLWNPPIFRPAVRRRNRTAIQGGDNSDFDVSFVW